MKFFSQSFLYDDTWSIVSLAYFLRYPNPYASHVISCDVISREQTDNGTLMTTRLILKRGNLPRWIPKGLVSRAESWLVEESEVDPFGKVVKCTTKNLDNLKVMRVEESVQFRQTADGKTLQHSEVRIMSGFGWGLTKRIENYGITKFQSNLQRSRDGVSLILELIRQSRLQPMTLGGNTLLPPNRTEPCRSPEVTQRPDDIEAPRKGSWSKIRGWWSRQPPPS
ncbi:MSF1-domain-containing protein [Coprinopsis marcescibilis]|uniref:MSF1-domain-containing protein n=1 Tax=Coprinopsis marcescibilis TaxID=230819 RepID=A0A5C3LD89_COPMA|nr:MSF1-domain-containing protein [Coprinopsis marcescibilis]